MRSQINVLSFKKMDAEIEPNSKEHGNASPRGSFKKIWIFAAGIALVAAFFFQWKNSVDQAAIAQLQGGGVIRAKIETAGTPAFRVFVSEKIGKENLAPPEVYDGNGNFLCKTERVGDTADNGELVFSPVFDDDFAREKFDKERFPRLAFFSLVEDGKPVVLVLKKSQN